jgi:RNA 2',3'-cyclic 3'-phosphodiesterase
MWRIFLSLPVPTYVVAQLLKLQQELAAGLREGFVSWTRPAQMHLTLRFLGDTPPARVEAIENAVTAVCADVAPFPLRARQAGFFPNPRRPRIIWAGVDDAGNRLAPLHAAVNEAIKSIVLETADEKDFRGHLTIGRIKRIDRREIKALAEAAERASGRCFGNWKANTIEIVRSELGPGGSRYTCVASIGLRGQG